MSLVSVVIFSMTGYAVSNYDSMKSSLLLIIFISIVILIYIFTLIFSKTIKKIKDLKEL